MAQDRREAGKAVGVARKVRYLSDPKHYPEVPRQVEVVETHMSWVFLAGPYVYKFKKPVASPHLDFRTLESRRANCLEEVRLNRRLASWVYLGVTALAQSDTGELTLGGGGAPAEWLVKMRRLPREAMLDRAVVEGRASVAEVQRVARVLTEFYQRSAPAATDPNAYLELNRTALDEVLASLSLPDYKIGQQVLDRFRNVLAEFLARAADSFKSRVAEGRVLEGHGDLRPEHVCLMPEPVMIDCLEFDRRLRILDVADEMAFLALECERLGAVFVGQTLFQEYGRLTGDYPPDDLVAFYKCRRGLLRAQQCLSHLHDGPTSAQFESKWRQRADGYLDQVQAWCGHL